MRGKKALLIIFWTAILSFSAWFYFDDAVGYLFGYRSPRFGDSFFNNQFWFGAHILGATCSLFLGPIQFWKTIRTKYLRFHRLAGKIYIIGSLIAATCAFRLTLTYPCVGCRYSLFPLSVLFLLTTVMAWYAIKRRNIEAHRQFMVRSYTCALAFVFVRLIQVIPMGFIFDPIGEPAVEDVVIEWTFSILPLLIVELFMVWIPSLTLRASTPR